MKQEHESSQIESATPAAYPDAGTDGWLHTLDLGVEMPDPEFRLYARYIRTLALLCECAPFVDDPDYLNLIDEMVADACKHYPLDCRRDGDRFELALRAPDRK